MCRRFPAAIVVVLVFAPPCAAKSKTADAVKAADAAKIGFHDRNAPSYTGFGSHGAGGVANRSLKVIVVAALADGTLTIQSQRGKPLGILDPHTIPELIAQDKARFGGRKHLEPGDLQPGQRLKLTFYGNTSEILKAKVLKDRSS